MTRMTGPDCVVMCNLINTHTHCCIHSTYCVPIMDGRRRGTRGESRKQALDSAWSMEMSRLTREMGLPNPFRETKFIGATGDREYFIFSVQLADHEQDWQPCPVAMVVHINIALRTYRCSYTYIYMHIQYTAVNRALT